jgi:hypothetical protein
MQAKDLRIYIGVKLLLTGYIVGTHTSVSVHAQTMGATIPSSYGRVVAGDSSSLWFEDTKGTLRQITIPAGRTIYTVTRER